MSLNPTITAAFKQQFHDSFIERAAQKESRFESCVTNRGTISGSSFTANQLGTVEMQPVTTRYEDKQPSDIVNRTFVAYMQDYDLPPLVVDTFDLVKLAADPTYKYVDLAVQAFNRRKDKTIYRALLDTANYKTAENSAFSTATIPTAQKIATGATAFTKAKAIYAASLFRLNEADRMAGEELFIAYDDNVVRAILSDTTLTSADYMATKMLENGEVAKNWLGFTWIPYNALDDGAGGTTESRTVAWAKSAIHFGTGIDIKTDVSENKTKRGNPTEVYAYASIGAVRVDEYKVVQIDYLNA